MLLSNRVALITGGATGMGRATAFLFAEEGCDVAIADIKLKEANETINQVKEKGRKGLAIECDVSNSSQVKETVKKVISKFGKIDILVNFLSFSNRLMPRVLGFVSFVLYIYLFRDLLRQAKLSRI